MQQVQHRKQDLVRVVPLHDLRVCSAFQTLSRPTLAAMQAFVHCGLLKFMDIKGGLSVSMYRHILTLVIAQAAELWESTGSFCRDPDGKSETQHFTAKTLNPGPKPH